MLILYNAEIWVVIGSYFIHGSICGQRKFQNLHNIIVHFTRKPCEF